MIFDGNATIIEQRLPKNAFKNTIKKVDAIGDNFVFMKHLFVKFSGDIGKTSDYKRHQLYTRVYHSSLFEIIKHGILLNVTSTLKLRVVIKFHTKCTIGSN